MILKWDISREPKSCRFFSNFPKRTFFWKAFKIFLYFMCWRCNLSQYSDVIKIEWFNQLNDENYSSLFIKKGCFIFPGIFSWCNCYILMNSWRIVWSIMIYLFRFSSCLKHSTHISLSATWTCSLRCINIDGASLFYFIDLIFRLCWNYSLSYGVFFQLLQICSRHKFWKTCSVLLSTK